MHEHIGNLQQRGMCPKRPNICVNSAEQRALSTASTQPQSKRTYPSLRMASPVTLHRTVNWTLLCIQLYAGRTLHLVTGSQQANHKTFICCSYWSRLIAHTHWSVGTVLVWKTASSKTAAARALEPTALLWKTTASSKDESISCSFSSTCAFFILKPLVYLCLIFVFFSFYNVWIYQINLFMTMRIYSFVFLYHVGFPLLLFLILLNNVNAHLLLRQMED